jgi:cystathionine beta-lyase
MYDFDRTIDRAPFNSIKWSFPELCYPGASAGDGILPLWVADMDFAVPPSVEEAVQRRAGHPVYGYAGKPGAFYDAFISWMARRQGAAVGKASLHFSPGIVTGLGLSVRAFTQPGDGVVIQPPVYHPFRMMIEKNGRRVLENPLVNEAGHWRMDLEGLEELCRREKPAALILCSPHNPVARVWTREELEGLIGVCARHRVLLVSDEIHSDIVYRPNAHTAALRYADALEGRLVAFFAPSKTFNIAGLQTSYAVIPDPELGRLFDTEAGRLGLDNPNAFGAAAAVAAYEGGEAWLEELLAYLAGNADFLCRELASRFPSLSMRMPEGTFLAWVDARGLGLEGDLHEVIARKAGVWFDDGNKFGKGGEGWLRLNFGCPRANLELALDRLEKALPSLQAP